MNFVSIKQLNNDIKNNLHCIPNDIDIVVGVPRSGMLVASIIALYMNLPLSDINSFSAGKIYSTGGTKRCATWKESFDDIKKVLIVEDSVYKGTSINNAKECLTSSAYAKNKNFIYLAAYVTDSAKDLVDLYFRIIEQPRTFEWNYLHVWSLQFAAFDIDGVLCEDPTDKQNDDGERYIDFLLNAPVKFRPTKKIGWLITSRLEKYRKETETWLANNNIEYGELIMLNLPSKSERLR